jgi:hypothetical protein
MFKSKLAILALSVCLSVVLGGRANADPLIDVFPVRVNIYLGNVNLYGPNNSISTSQFMTVETDNPVRSFDPVNAPAVLLFQGQSDAASIAADTGMLPFVRNNIVSFEGSNGLGLQYDFNSGVHPAETQFNALLVANHPASVSIISQGLPVLFGGPIDFAYLWLFPVSQSLSYEGVTVVDVFQEAINERVASVREPSTWAMLLLGFAGLGVMAYRRKSKPALMAT